VELLFRWSRRGTVYWDAISLMPTSAPAKQVVKVATVRYRPERQTKGPDENLRLFSQMIDKAAAHKPDVIVLGEGITVVSTSKTYVDVAEPIPGPTTTCLGQLSKKHACYIVAGIYERVRTVVYNTAVLTGPNGKLVGTYRKTCLPREEIEGGITPGSEYPVFDTRFGKVGIMICWDIHFPEVARRLAINGAELILVPIWGGNELLARARAVENQLYIATSSYSDKIRTAVWDRRGNAVAQAKQWGDVAVTDIDLNARTMWDWLGDFKARIPRERPRREAE
jgi:predicted amidohydrolase